MFGNMMLMMGIMQAAKLCCALSVTRTHGKMIQYVYTTRYEMTIKECYSPACSRPKLPAPHNKAQCTLQCVFCPHCDDVGASHLRASSVHAEMQQQQPGTAPLSRLWILCDDVENDKRGER
jgi:hypothetical protein